MTFTANIQTQTDYDEHEYQQRFIAEQHDEQAAYLPDESSDSDLDHEQEYQQEREEQKDGRGAPLPHHGSSDTDIEKTALQPDEGDKVSASSFSSSSCYVHPGMFLPITVFYALPQLAELCLNQVDFSPSLASDWLQLPARLPSLNALQFSSCRGGGSAAIQAIQACVTEGQLSYCTLNWAEESESYIQQIHNNLDHGADKATFDRHLRMLPDYSVVSTCRDELSHQWQQAAMWHREFNEQRR